MTISIWRYSHLALAISSALFIIIASITGIILAFEPIANKLKPFAVENIEALSLANTIAVLEKKYDEVIEIEVDENNFVSVAVITKKGNSETFYINPKTGNKIGEIIKKQPIFEFATNLHRSLFLKSTGRLLIGFVSFLLFLIASTGVVLIAKRQGGIYKFFSKIVKDNFNQYYHIVIGRYAFIPIIIITLTGVYLSLEKFSLLPKDTSSHQKTPQKEMVEKLNFVDFKIFKSIKLNDVKKIEFPFSTDKEDYFFVKLKDTELAVQQYNGQVISQKKQNLIAAGSYYSLLLHTGEGSFIWSIILALTCFAILFFVFSGFSMTLNRKKKTSLINNKFSKDNAEYIILVGSETGSTFKFATIFYNALIAANKTVFLSELNNYTTYNKAQNIIIFTATYGDGEAPVNANKFIQKIKKTPQKRVLKFSVVGFGSVEYKEFCKFAILVHANLQLHNKFVPILPVLKINNQSTSVFIDWTKEWSSYCNINLKISNQNFLEVQENEGSFKVISKTEINNDDTFLVQLKPNASAKFTSGDLLSIAPKKGQRNRLYSIAKINDRILLSIKKHEFGVCSNYFNTLLPNNKVVAKIKRNKHFYFPKNAKEVILIANGTGIAPFLGMIQKNKKKRVHLFWGGRTKSSLEIYKSYIDNAIKNESLTSFNVAYSQKEREKIYVQDILQNQTELITTVIKNKGVILICGSLNMQKGVEKVIDKIAKEKVNSSLEKLKEQRLIKTDCY